MLLGLPFRVEGDRVIFEDGSDRPATEVEKALWKKQFDPVLGQTIDKVDLLRAAVLVLGVDKTYFSIYEKKNLLEQLKRVGFRGLLLFLPTSASAITLDREAVLEVLKVAVNYKDQEI